MPTINQVLDAYTDMTWQAFKLVKNKGIHYSGENEDTFDNLKACEKNNVCGRVTGVIVRIYDKIARVKNVAAKMEARTPVEDETIVQTCIDASNYFMYIPILVAEYLAEKNNTTFEMEFNKLKKTKVQKLVDVIQILLKETESETIKQDVENILIEMDLYSRSKERKKEINWHKARKDIEQFKEDLEKTVSGTTRNE